MKNESQVGEGENQHLIGREYTLEDFKKYEDIIKIKGIDIKRLQESKKEILIGGWVSAVGLFLLISKGLDQSHLELGVGLVLGPTLLIGGMWRIWGNTKSTIEEKTKESISALLGQDFAELSPQEAKDKLLGFLNKTVERV